VHSLVLGAFPRAARLGSSDVAGCDRQKHLSHRKKSVEKSISRYCIGKSIESKRHPVMFSLFLLLPTPWKEVIANGKESSEEDREEGRQEDCEEGDQEGQEDSQEEMSRTAAGIFPAALRPGLAEKS
jgi:hypothetical protein